mmetsp:Transcript_20723/g.52241  ORF Transcript_20723/g.52241 Transcript_20723/m.52241 type:complete len:287 (-) Transcript_20723:226-1086(-)
MGVTRHRYGCARLFGVPRRGRPLPEPAPEEAAAALHRRRQLRGGVMVQPGEDAGEAPHPGAQRVEHQVVPARGLVHVAHQRGLRLGAEAALRVEELREPPRLLQLIRDDLHRVLHSLHDGLGRLRVAAAARQRCRRLGRGVLEGACQVCGGHAGGLRRLAASVDDLVWGLMVPDHPAPTAHTARVAAVPAEYLDELRLLRRAAVAGTGRQDGLRGECARHGQVAGQHIAEPASQHLVKHRSDQRVRQQVLPHHLLLARLADLCWPGHALHTPGCLAGSGGGCADTQ